MLENPRRGRQAPNFTNTDPKILDLKLSSKRIIFRKKKLSFGTPDVGMRIYMTELQGVHIANFEIDLCSSSFEHCSIANVNSLYQSFTVANPCGYWM